MEALRHELMGPSEPQETIPEYPTTRYIVGRLAPARAADDDTDAAINPTENDSFGVGTGDDENGDEGTSPPLIIGFNPSSMGLSFLVDDPSTRSASMSPGATTAERRIQRLARFGADIRERAS